MMGERLMMQDSLFYEFRLEDHVPTDHRLRTIDRFIDLSDLRRHLASFYSTIGRALDRPGTDDPDADRGLLLWHPFGATPVRESPSQPRLPLVPQIGAGRPGAGPLDLLKEPSRPVPRERCVPPSVRNGGGALGMRLFCGGALHDIGHEQVSGNS